MQDLNEIVNRIEELRISRGLSKSKAFSESGVGRSFIDNLKKGSIPSMDKFQKLADYFGVSVDYLLTGSEKETPPTDEQWERDLINDVSRLSPERQKEVKDFVAFQIRQESHPE